MGIWIFNNENGNTTSNMEKETEQFGISNFFTNITYTINTKFPDLTIFIFKALFVSNDDKNWQFIKGERPVQNTTDKFIFNKYSNEWEESI